MEIKGNHTQFNEEDPLSSVIQDLTKLTTDATRDQREISSMASKEAQNEENIDDSIGSPDSLDACNLDIRPIPPPRTRIPAATNAISPSPANCLSIPNGSSTRQLSSSEHDLSLSLPYPGKYLGYRKFSRPKFNISFDGIFILKNNLF